jgi:hypothetical protein
MPIEMIEGDPTLATPGMAHSVNTRNNMELPMSYAQSPPLVETEWLSAGEPARDLNAHSDQRIETHSPPPSSLKEGQVARDRPSIGRRLFRNLPRFSIAVLIGIGTTLGWQSYGDAAREMLVDRAPTLARLLPVSTMKSPVVAATSPDMVQQLKPLTFSLEVVRRSVEQLAAKQEQMAQSIAALQAVEEDVRQKMSFTPRSPAQQAASVQQPKPQSRAPSSSVPRPPSAAPGIYSR